MTSFAEWQAGERRLTMPPAPKGAREGMRPTPPRDGVCLSEHDVAHELSQEAAGDMFGERWAYVPEIAQWREWEEGRGWRNVRGSEVGLWVGEKARGLLHSPRVNAGPVADKRTAGALKFTANVVRLMGLLHPWVVPLAHWDADPYTLGLPAGEVWDMRRWQKRLQAPGDFVFLSTAVPPDGASAEATKTWDAFVEQMFEDPDTREYVQVALGGALIGEALDDRAYFLVGVPGSGKTTLLSAVHAALGGYASTVDPDLILKRGRTDIYSAGAQIVQLQGVRLAYASEVGVGEDLDVRAFKALSGGEELVGRLLGRNPVRVRVCATLFLGANEAPAPDHADPGVYRRLRIIPSLTPPPNPDETLRMRLRNPQSGRAILGWMLAGLRKRIERGAPPAPPQVAAETEEHYQGVDRVGEWWAERVERHGGGRVSLADLRSDLAEWAAARGYEALPAADRWLPSRLRERGVEVARVRFAEGVRRGVAGYRLRPQSVPLPAENKDYDPYIVEDQS